IAERWAGVVGDQDVRLRACSEQGVLALLGGDVRGDCDDLRLGRLADVVRRGVEPRLVESVDHDLAAGLSQPRRAGPAEPAARGADNGLAAGDTQIHVDPPVGGAIIAAYRRLSWPAGRGGPPS